VMGVYEGRLTTLAAGALRELGSERALALHGDIGLDEISTIGPTRVSELRDGEVTDYVLTPRDLGLDCAEPDPEDLAPAATPEENADLLVDVLSGVARDDRRTAARRDLVAVNAAASLRVCGFAEGWPEAVRLAHRILASGEALAKVRSLAEFSSTLG
jgi:anthranilate phosphoribosyltransferase